MEFRILGPLEVAVGDEIVALASAKQRALLAILLLSANQVVSSDRLIDELWGEQSPESGRTALQVLMSKLRKALGDAGALLVTRPPGYLIRLERDQLDLHRFERLVGEADDAEPEAAAGRLRGALALWRGFALDDLGTSRLPSRRSDGWRSFVWRRSRSESTRTWRSAATATSSLSSRGWSLSTRCARVSEGS